MKLYPFERVLGITTVFMFLCRHSNLIYITVITFLTEINQFLIYIYIPIYRCAQS